MSEVKVYAHQIAKFILDNFHLGEDIVVIDRVIEAYQLTEEEVNDRDEITDKRFLDVRIGLAVNHLSRYKLIENITESNGKTTIRLTKKGFSKRTHDYSV